MTGQMRHPYRRQNQKAGLLGQMSQPRQSLDLRPTDEPIARTHLPSRRPEQQHGHIPLVAIFYQIVQLAQRLRTTQVVKAGQILSETKPFGLAAFGAKPAKRSQLDQRCAQRLDRSQSRQSLGLEGPSGLTPAPATANWQSHQSALLQLAEQVARGDVLKLAGG